MANKQQIDALQIKLDERTVELAAANVEIDTLNTCKLAVQNQLEDKEIQVQRLENTRDTLEKSLHNSKTKVNWLKERIKLKDEYTQDILNNREG